MGRRDKCAHRRRTRLALYPAAGRTCPPMNWSGRGYCSNLNRPREAADFASRVVAAQPGDPNGWVILAHCLESMDEPARALEIANRAIGLRPDDPEPHLIASRVLRKMKNYSLAIVAGEEAVRLAPMAAATHVNLAVALASLGRGDLSLFGHLLPRHLRRAAEHAANAVRLAPSSAAGYFAAGFVASASGRRRLALQNYRRVLAIDPQHAAAMNNIALIDFHRGRLGAGGSGFARAIRADPTLSLARGNAIVVVRQTALLFQGLWWLLYCSFSGIAASPASGAFAFAWTTRGEVALLLCAALGVLAVVAFGRMDPAVRSLARRVVARSWLVKILVVADFMTLVCFLMANLGRGSVVATWYGFGVIGILLAVLANGVAGWALRK